MRLTKGRSKRRGMYVVAAWACGAMAVLTGAMWIAGNFATPSAGVGGVCAFVSPSQLQLAFANQPVKRQQDRWFFQQATAAVIMPGNVLRPTMPRASMTVGTQGGAIVTISVRVVSVPLWQMLLLLLIVGGGAWRLSRRMFPAGHCSECGYDLQGLENGKCPECGDGFVARVIAVVRRAMDARRRVWPAEA